MHASMAQDRLKKLREELAQRKSERLYEKQAKPEVIADSGPSGVMVAFNCQSTYTFCLHDAWSLKTQSRGAMTDNMETQAWPHDAQPSFENGGVARQLSFEGVASEPSPIADRKAEAEDPGATKCVEPPVSVSGPRPKRGSWRWRRGACRNKPKAPEAAVLKPPEPAEEAPNSLPDKPDCMLKMQPTLSPDEQQQPKPKGRAKKSKDEDEKMDEEDEADEEDEQEQAGDDEHEETDERSSQRKRKRKMMKGKQMMSL